MLAGWAFPVSERRFELESKRQPLPLGSFFLIPKPRPLPWCLFPGLLHAWLPWRPCSRGPPRTGSCLARLTSGAAE